MTPGGSGTRRRMERAVVVFPAPVCLSYQSQGLAVFQLDIQTVYGLNGSVVGFIMDHKILNIKNQVFFIFCHCSCPPLFL